MPSSTTRPRPIHQPPREIRSEPDENEPSSLPDSTNGGDFFYEDVEDDFHRRLKSNRRDSGGSFWRTTSDQMGPTAFQSMKMTTNKGREESVSTSNSSTGSAAPRRPSLIHLQQQQQATEVTMSSPDQRTKSSSNNKGGGAPASGGRESSKNTSKQLSSERRRKLEAQHSDLDLGHLEVAGETTPASPPLLIPPTADAASLRSRSRSTSSGSGSTMLQHYTSSSSANKTTTRNVGLLGKGTSLIFPTGIDGSSSVERTSTNASSSNDDKASSEAADPMSSIKRQKLNLLLDQCETVRFPFKKKLVLDNLQLSAADVPVKDLDGTPLGNTLHKLSLTRNRLSVVPPRLVTCLPLLKHLDLSQCDLVSLPERWDLPMLKRLNLSHNRLVEFPDELMLEGLPELQELNMYGNKVAEIIVPRDPKILSKLETLNLGYNDLAYLPDDLDQLKSLRTLKVMNNFLEKVPMRVCDMDIRTIDVSSNPVMQPPIETCERGICSMKRYYHCLRLEEQTKHKAVEAAQSRRLRKSSKKDGGKFRKINRFFGKSSTVSDDGSGRSGDSHGVGRDEQPMVLLPSRPDDPVLTRKRSVSYDAILKAQQAKAGELAKDDAAAAANNSSYPELRVPDVDALTGALVSTTSDETQEPLQPEDVTVNDTLKVIFVGMAMTGKTSMIKRLIEGKDAVIPQRDDRTIGVDIYEWDPNVNTDRGSVDTKIELDDKELAKTLETDVNVKFSVWDFAGQHVYHATHELFFSPRSLYVLVWDMGATNTDTQRRKSYIEFDQANAFKLTYDSSDDEEDDDFLTEEATRLADRALERDIDEKVQFWVECIQSCAPGAAILPVATFDDYFEDTEGADEATRRCNIMKNRLIKHEERRIAGIKERLKEFTRENRADDEVAVRLRNLLCPYTRPKLIFGESVDDSVVRVSGTKYTGFDKLTKVIVDVASGRDKCGGRFPVFRGHVGARIPRMRLEVRDAVREMRDRFKVVEWGYFVSTLQERGLTSAEDISDALHFLTNIGELSFFGNVYPDRQMMDKMLPAGPTCGDQSAASIALRVADDDGDDGYDDDDDDLDEGNAILSVDNTSITAPSTQDDGSLSIMDDLGFTGLSQFVFLNPRWLVASVACILRHDLEREIRETRRSLSTIARGDSFYSANLNCPVITAEDACLLWQAKKFTKKAADRAQQYSNNMVLTPFDFLQRLLVRFGVFVPIDLSIEKALLGGKEYARALDEEKDDKPAEIIALAEDANTSDTPQFFFLPSLLGPGEPTEAWTYKNTESWKATLCHSILFPDGVPPGLMERITASVLSSVYAVSQGLEQVVLTTFNGQPAKTLDGQLRVKEILCWRTAFFLKLGTEVKSDNGESKESTVEIFVNLADRESHLCVGSNEMGIGMRRLVVSGKGQVGDGGRKIWNGGYLLVIKSVGRVMNEYEGLEFEKHAFCPECLSKKAVSAASHWDWTVVRAAAKHGDGSMRCRHGHRVDTRLITGPCDTLSKPMIDQAVSAKFNDSEPIVPVNDLLRGIVLVGLWDGKSRKVVRVGSGFIVDKKRGLIVTASHTLMNIWGDKNSPFGENYYGLRDGKVVIGVIPRKKDSDSSDGTMAVFRYFASVVAKDPMIDEKGECNLDACVLRITTRMENDIAGNGEGCGDQPEILLQHNPDAMKREKLQQLKVTDKCELDEQVRILGYNQGGEGLLGPGESLNRYVDFARGYCCKLFSSSEDEGSSNGSRYRFKPREEIVVICPTIGGHSGGPCVNQQGEVIGILSRADPAENQRCYLVPAKAWRSLVKKAKNRY